MREEKDGGMFRSEIKLFDRGGYHTPKRTEDICSRH